MEEIQIICKDCDQAFTFSASDQAFFAERGFSTPVRCKRCRQLKKMAQPGQAPAVHQASEQIRSTEKPAPKIEDRKKHNPRRKTHQSSDSGEERDWRRDYRIKW